MQITDLVKTFGTGETATKVLRGLDLTLKAGEGRETATARGCDLLTRMGLADRISVPTAKLSVGQKQRVAVARALMNRE